MTITARAARLALAFSLVTLPATFAAPVAAQQFSAGYKFLKAVRDADGAEVNKILGEPGQSIINTKDRSTGEGALHIVAKRSDATYLRFLLQKGANPNMTDERGNTPMMLAVENGFSEGIDALKTYKADPNIANHSGETPLIRAVQMRRFEIVRDLLAAGADPDQTDVIAGLSAREYAVRDARSPAITKLLADAPKRARAPAGAAGPRL
ncbi:ankyrin repeat domain-containing protein [Sphingomonas sp. 37zxx]|uniref:ankyrin repeat domain-containing protein n=1 Tax=Sphingomonas sp. 37zxx TaxID=1550073 RepID=UPI000A63B188|nr:ankyrin repeat domain-containing protein [Sphingomonas sp. 37zxx]